MAIAPDGPASLDRHLVVTSRLRGRRQVLGLTQKQVVTRLASLGVACTNKSLSSLEHGTGVDVNRLPEMAAALDCTVTYLLGLTDDPRSWRPDAALTWQRPSDRVTGAVAGRHAPVAGRPGGPTEPPAGADQRGDGEPHGWILGPYVPERTARGTGPR